MVMAYNHMTVTAAWCPSASPADGARRRAVPCRGLATLRGPQAAASAERTGSTALSAKVLSGGHGRGSVHRRGQGSALHREPHHPGGRQVGVAPLAAQKQQYTTFEGMLEASDVPVLVDFYAVWCGPCQMLGPILDEVGAALRGRMKIVKIDSDKYPQLASQYQVQALPTLMLFKNGQVVDRFEGVMVAQQMIPHYERFLK